MPDEVVHERVLSRRLCSGCGLDWNLLAHRPKVPDVCDICNSALVVREDDHPEALAVRLRDYHDKTSPVIELFQRKEFVATFDATRSIADIQAEIRRRFSSSPSRRQTVSGPMNLGAERRRTDMAIVTCDLAISLDGYSAGPNQSLDRPFGDGVDDPSTLHSWMFDHADAHRAELAGITASGAFIMGRNMFSPGRGAWDLEWKGWWGPDPPYHAPVYVLTHLEREPLEMAGGTTFHFVTGGPQQALELARDAAGDRNVAIAGGATTINQFLAGGMIDELRLHVVPVVIDAGYVRLFDGVGPTTLSSTSARWTPEVTHLVYTR